MKKLLMIMGFLGFIVFLSGCAENADLYPVQGPISISNPQIIKCKFIYNGTGHGTIEVFMPDGEICKGEYSTISEGSFSTVSGTAISRHDWATIFGEGFSVSNMQPGMATAIGNKGTIISVEYYVDAFSDHGFGVGKDNKGNLYRLQF